MIPVETRHATGLEWLLWALIAATVRWWREEYGPHMMLSYMPGSNHKVWRLYRDALNQLGATEPGAN